MTLCIFKGFCVFPGCQLLPDSVCSGKIRRFPSGLLALQPGLILCHTMGLQRCSSRIWPHILNVVDSPVKDGGSGAASLQLCWPCCVESSHLKFTPCDCHRLIWSRVSSRTRLGGCFYWVRTCCSCCSRNLWYCRCFILL